MYCNSFKQHFGKIKNSVNREIANVFDWLTANKLSLNISKTNVR